MPQVLRLIAGDRAYEKMEARGITRRDLVDVLAGRHVITRNRKDRAASHVLIGWDGQGRCLAVPILPTDDPSTWQAFTAWHCKPGEAAKLR